MDKKILLFLSLIFLVGFLGVVGFVNASNQLSEIQLHKGWNLVYGFTGTDRILSGGDISSTNIKAVYLLTQPSQEYVRVYPDPESDKLWELDDDYYEKTAQWVYSDKSGILKYNSEEPLPLGELKLYRGWNFVGITSNMIGPIEVSSGSFIDGQVQHIAGTCNIEKSYFFDPRAQEWVIFPLDEDFSDGALGSGWIVKLSNDCKLGLKVGVIGPPELP